jgi:hypothetical protein
LSEVYSENELSKLENPDYLCFVATQGYFINDMGAKDLSQYPDISTLKPLNASIPAISAANFDEASFNLLKYQFELQEGTPLIYRIGDSGKTLFIHSKVRMDVLFERALINQNANK